jgi:serine protease Do
MTTASEHGEAIGRSPNFLIGICIALAAVVVGTAALSGDDAGPREPVVEGGAPTKDLSKSFKSAAKKVRPSVVNITTERWIDMDKNNPLIGFLGRMLEGRDESRAQLQRSYGTGFVVRADGTVLTNDHVVTGAKRVRARLGDGTEVDAEVIGTDPLSDVAVLRLAVRPDGKAYVPVEFGDSDALEVGDWVLAIGNPFGLAQTVTAGIVSAKGRSRVGIAAYEDFIQTDAAINPGNSGGPLLDLDGRVVGVATAIAARRGRSLGIGFAIPSDMARKVMEDVLANGRVVRGWLGVSIQNASTRLTQRLGLGDRGGALVGGAVPGGPADQAGMVAGDLIVAINGEPINDSTRLRHRIARAPVGTPLALSLVRDGVTVELSVVPTERESAAEPEPEPEAPAPTGLGITARQITPELAGFLGFAEDAKGVVITRVEHGSLAADQGVRPGMVLQAVDRKPIHTLADLDAAVAAMDLRGKGVLLRVWDGEYARFVLLE